MGDEEKAQQEATSFVIRRKLSGWDLLPGVGPREVQVHRPLVNQPPVIRPQDKKTSPVNRPLVTSQPVITQINTSQSITCHRSSSHRSLDLEIQTRQKSIFTGHWSTGHWSAVMRLYISLQLVILMPLAWSSQQINQIWVLNTHTDMKFRTQHITQEEFYYPWSQTSNISDPCVVIEPPDNKWRSHNRQTTNFTFWTCLQEG